MRFISFTETSEYQLCARYYYGRTKLSNSLMTLSFYSSEKCGNKVCVFGRCMGNASCGEEGGLFGTQLRTGGGTGGDTSDRAGGELHKIMGDKQRS